MTSTIPLAAVGFIGLGDQGAPMARAIGASRYELNVWARRPQSLDALSATPHTVHRTVAELGAASDIVLLVVRDDIDVIDILENQGLLKSMKPGSIIVNHGTGDVDKATDIAAMAAAYGISVLDAPVSGGGPGAEARQLTTIAGGDRTTFDRATAVFQTFSSAVVYMGPAGSGQVAKLLNNALTMTNLKNAEDVLGFADVLGVDVAAFLQLLRTSSGGSFVLNALGNEITSELAPHLQVLMKKDMEHFADAISREGVDVDEVRARGIAGAEGLVTVTELVDRHLAASAVAATATATAA